MKQIFFDIDDTLYDQLAPFAQAYDEVFGNDYPKLDVEALFVDSRARSDEVFDMVERGELPKEKMYAYRITQAFKDFGVTVTDDVADVFQKHYAKYQSRIVLLDDIKILLKQLAKTGYPLGVITNGPKAHQLRKVKALGLTQYIPKERLFISGAIGAAKPHQAAFRYVEKTVGAKAADCVYIGDAFPIDVTGAKNAGWTAVWLNRRHHDVPKDATVSPDLTVADEHELLAKLPVFLKEIK